jgi:hypothetical protein
MPKSNRTIDVLMPGIIVGLVVFLIVTSLVTATSFENLPHGVFVGWWDDFENRQGGMEFIDQTTDETLSSGGDIDFQSISSERFLRYVLPPFMRHFCLTGNDSACRWADTDVRNFEDREEWIEFLRRFWIGTASGLVTSLMAWILTGITKTLQPGGED